MTISNFKTFGSIAIMIGCFAIIYPRFMHPLVSKVLGLQGDVPKQNSYKDSKDDRFSSGQRDLPPHIRHGSEDMQRHMRGPHPGMRAAAEMQKQQAAQKGSGRGMMGVVLPMYAIGIVLYLLYTLFKVFNKQGKKKMDHCKEDRMGFPSNFEGNDVQDFLHNKQQRKDLEDLLARVDDKNVSVDEMRLLQKRLEETEAQMTRILQAMQHVQSNVDTLAAEDVPTKQAPDSSPDMETYEVVSQSSDKLKTSDPEKDVSDHKVDEDELTDLDGITKDETEDDNETEVEKQEQSEVEKEDHKQGDNEEPDGVRQRKPNKENEQ